MNIVMQKRKKSKMNVMRNKQKYENRIKILILFSKNMRNFRQWYKFEVEMMRNNKNKKIEEKYEYFTRKLFEIAENEKNQKWKWREIIKYKQSVKIWILFSKICEIAENNQK